MAEVRIPDIGDFAEVAVIEILVKVGDEVAAEAPLIVLESDKATMDVPSPFAGVISAVHIKVGDKIAKGALIAELTTTENGNDGNDNPPVNVDKQNATTGGESEGESSRESKEESKTTAAPKSQSGGSEELRVPDIGDFKDIGVIDVLVKPGDVITAEQSLIVLESDKATMDVPAEKGGTVGEVHIKVGDKINIGDVICRITTGAAQQPESQPPQQSQPPSKPTQPPQTPSAPLPAVVESKSTFGKAHAGPAVRRFARELGVDLSQVRGSARLGRIVKSDVKAFAKAQLQSRAQSGDGLPAMPEIDFSKYGGVEIHPLARVRKLSATNLRRNWLVAPHVTQFADADITEMDAFRKSLAEKSGTKMTPLAFLLKAAAAALREFPRFNASLAADGENLVMKNYFHIGVAVDTPQGLVVPVLRDVDRKGLNDIAAELAEISTRARTGKLKAEEMRGGCFSISSLGGIGGAHFTPIINLPEAAILGVGRAQTMPKWDGEQFRPRLSLPLALSYDHRIIDGAEGARFITFYADLLTDTRRLAL